MSNRRKLRVPGRYERPAVRRGPLGDDFTERGIQAGYREGNRARVDLAHHRRAEAQAAVLTEQLVASGYVPLADEPVREVATVESAATLERGGLVLRESVGGSITEAPKDTATGRLVTIDVIRSGWNSSGSRFYPGDVLERDVPKVYGKGTQVYLDHPSASEQDDRPERSLQTLAGVFVDTPWAVKEADGGVTMRTTVRVFSPHQPLIRDAWDSIGVSINGSGRGDHGTAEGREGILIEALTYGRSVDFVTVPGAGGRVLGLLESNRPAPADVITQEAGSLGAFVESRIHLGFTEIGDDLYAGGYCSRGERIALSKAIGAGLTTFVDQLEQDAPQLYQRGRFDGPPPDDGVATTTTEAAAARTREATAEQSRMALDRALQAAYGGEKRYAWVEDYDPDQGVVWFHAGSHEESGRSGTWQQSYTTTSGNVQLTGDRVQVRARTVYEPVTGTTTEATTPTGPTGGEVSTTEATPGPVPADGNDGPTVPATTTKENTMGEKSPEVVAREAAEARLAEETRIREGAETELARYRAGDTARPIIEQLLAESDLPDLARARVRVEYGTPAALPLIESTRGLDETNLRARVAASITAEKNYVAGLLEAAGVGQVRGNGAAAGAGAGMPAGYVQAPSNTSTGMTGGQGSYFGYDRPAPVQLSEADRAQVVEQREAMIRVFESRGLSRTAAEQAADR